MTMLASNEGSYRDFSEVPSEEAFCDGAHDAGSPQARLLAAEFERLYTRVYRYLLHRTFNPEMADELCAQTFHRAAASTNKMPRETVRMEAWLLRVATNVANTQYRKQRIRRLLLGRFADSKRSADRPDMEATSVEEQRKARIRAIVAGLAPKYQAVVVMRFYSHMSHAEIATVLNCTEVAVRKRLSRAVRRLRERFTDELS